MVGITYIVKTAMGVLRSEWGKVPIPGEQGSITEPILGTIDYDVTNITLLPNPILPDPTITLVPSSSLIIEVYVRSYAAPSLYRARWRPN